ncbi:MAG: chemotaxis response regulator protein-glutamate methylesterase [Alphaproteobacteria bacterium]|nr:chemotaxis response regulator protein-glutamate methylesterase [Alphaproteobacteria bacterium]
MSIRVLIVDDSALIRGILAKILPADGDIEVVGAAEDPIVAREMIKTHSPDVLTLDIEMPNMNGLEFLDRIMRLRPMPVVMVSTLTHKGARETLLALELGAVDFVAKPARDFAGAADRFAIDLRTKVRAAAASSVKARLPRPGAQPRAPAAMSGALAGALAAEALIAIGASTGGVEAVKIVLEMMPANCPPIVIAQHMPKGFTERFAQRLNEVTPLSVHEAKDRMPLLPGHAYVAPGDLQLRVEKSSGQLKCRTGDDPPVSGHRPSVDVLFGSVAEQLGHKAAGAILTGMGRDGAEGLKKMRDAGAYTVGQSKSSSLIYGMPKAAFEAGAVIDQVPVEGVASKLIEALGTRRNAA